MKRKDIVFYGIALIWWKILSANAILYKTLLGVS